MENIKSYAEFINESYNENLINEGIINDLKQKVMRWWNNFQNKEEVIRNIKNLADKGKWALIAVYSIILLTYLIPSVGEWSRSLPLNPVYNSYWIVFAIQQMCNWLFIPLGKARVKIIKRKLEELRPRFAGDEFFRDYCIILGDKRNIDACVNRMKEDGIVDDDGILNTSDVTIIDLHGMINHKKLKTDDKSHLSIDPYSEEDWFETEEDAKKRRLDNFTFNAYRVTFMHLSKMYNVTFRNINQETDFNDKYFRNSKRREKVNTETAYVNYLHNIRRDIENAGELAEEDLEFAEE